MRPSCDASAPARDVTLARHHAALARHVDRAAPPKVLGALRAIRVDRTPTLVDQTLRLDRAHFDRRRQRPHPVVERIRRPPARDRRGPHRGTRFRCRDRRVHRPHPDLRRTTEPATEPRRRGVQRSSRAAGSRAARPSRQPPPRRLGAPRHAACTRAPDQLCGPRQRDRRAHVRAGDHARRLAVSRRRRRHQQCRGRRDRGDRQLDHRWRSIDARREHALAKRARPTSQCRQRADGGGQRRHLGRTRTHARFRPKRTRPIRS